MARRSEPVVRRGLGRAFGRDLYHGLLTLTWPRFVGLLALGYLLMNALFASLYALVPHGIAGARPGSLTDAFFFSVQTLATIGYGAMYPAAFATNVLVAIESTVGILALPLVTGLVFAKFARPTARVLFSRRALITVRDGHPALVFRMANARGNQIVEARARVVLACTETTAEGESIRRLHDLPLLRSESPFFALTWLVIHRIDGASPLHGATRASLVESTAEIVVSLVGIDETLAQTINARWTYVPDDLVWGGRFVDVLTFTPDGRRTVDYTRFHDVEPHSESREAVRR